MAHAPTPDGSYHSGTVAITALIVDDQEDVRFLIRAILETSTDAISVVGEAARGAEAIRLVEALDPHVVILDHMMPGMDGIETAMRIRAKRPEQRMILCSAYLDETLMRRAYAVGFADCVPKTHVGRIPESLQRVMSA